jgi:hypothetical protein
MELIAILVLVIVCLYALESDKRDDDDINKPGPEQLKIENNL